MKYNVLDKKIEIKTHNSNWVMFNLGNKRKKSKAEDIVISSAVKEEQLVKYLSDLCHDWA